MSGICKEHAASNAQVIAVGEAMALFTPRRADALADRMIHTLEQRGVDLSLTERRAELPTGLYIKDPGADVI